MRKLLFCCILIAVAIILIADCGIISCGEKSNPESSKDSVKNNNNELIVRLSKTLKDKAYDQKSVEIIIDKIKENLPRPLPAIIEWCKAGCLYDPDESSGRNKSLNKASRWSVDRLCLIDALVFIIKEQYVGDNEKAEMYLKIYNEVRDATFSWHWICSVNEVLSSGQIIKLANEFIKKPEDGNKGVAINISRNVSKEDPALLAEIKIITEQSLNDQTRLAGLYNLINNLPIGELKELLIRRICDDPDKEVRSTASRFLLSIIGKQGFTLTLNDIPDLFDMLWDERPRQDKNLIFTYVCASLKHLSGECGFEGDTDRIKQEIITPYIKELKEEKYDLKNEADRKLLIDKWQFLCSKGFYKEEEIPAISKGIFSAKTELKEKLNLTCALGLIGSDEAVKVYKDFIQTIRSRLNSTVFKFGEYDYPALHYGKSRINGIAVGTDEKGISWTLFAETWLGQEDFYLVNNKGQGGGNWNPPIFTGQIKPRDACDFTFTSKDNDFIISYKEKPGKADKKNISISLSNITKDADNDGLPDIVEERLGLDPKNPDTDGDGMKDGADACPNATAVTKLSDDEQVRQSVWYLVAGNFNSRHLVLMSGHKQQLEGYSGLVLFINNQNELSKFKGSWFPGYYVPIISFDIKIEGNKATVIMNDYEGPVSASAHRIRLKKINGVWMPISIRMLWIS